MAKIEPHEMGRIIQPTKENRARIYMCVLRWSRLAGMVLANKLRIRSIALS